MKIGFYYIPTTQLLSFVEPYYLSALKLNHYVHITNNISECFADDITFLFIFNKFTDDIYKSIYNKSKCVVLVQTEQIHLNKDYLEGYKEALNYTDVSAVTMPEIKEFTILNSNKPVIDLFYGYHTSKTIYQNIKEKFPINWDVFNLDGKIGQRTDFYNRLDDERINYFKDTPLYDPYKIAYYSLHSKICLNVNFYGLNACLSTSRVIGSFIANKGFCIIQRTSYPFLKDKEHLIYFDSADEMVDKILYYINHQEEAKQIALNAFEFAKKNINLEDHVKKGVLEAEKFIKRKSIITKLIYQITKN